MSRERQHLAEMLIASRLHGRADLLRSRTPFSEDIEATNAVLFNPKYSKRLKVRAYRKWLEQNQPCVFGRIAAKNKNAFICLIEEREILAMKRGDADLMDTLQDYRQAWKRYALDGLVSSFVIVVVTPSLVHKQPDQALKEIARRLLELYMEIDRIEDDSYHTQREWVFLRRKVGVKQTYLKFSTLPNIFCAQGDHRWWHDHRTPGGLMVTSNALGHFMYARGKGDLDSTSKTWALENAMRTINNAHRGSKTAATKFCPATNLIPRRSDETSPLRATFDLAAMSADHYEGFFHTDHLIPSVYFEAKIPTKAPQRYEDLTLRYIYDEAADPEEHAELMTGLPATIYEAKRDMDRLPDFADPQRSVDFDLKSRARLADWLEKRLRDRLG